MYTNGEVIQKILHPYPENRKDHYAQVVKIKPRYLNNGVEIGVSETVDRKGNDLRKELAHPVALLAKLEAIDQQVIRPAREIVPKSCIQKNAAHITLKNPVMAFTKLPKEFSRKANIKSFHSHEAVRAQQMADTMQINAS